VHLPLKLGRLSVAVVCCALTGAAAAFAQGQTGGLYGATRSDVGNRDKLNVEMFLSEAFNSEVPVELRSFIPGNDLPLGRHSTMFAASADYARNRRRAQLFGTASTYFRYAPDLDRLTAVSHHAVLGTAVRLPSQGSLKITQTATYSPPYLYQLFPSAAPLPPGEAMPVNAAYRTESNAYHTTLALTFGSSRGTQVTTTAEYGATDFDRPAAARYNLTTYTTGARVTRALSRSGGVSAEYQYQSGDFALGGVTKEHRITMGVTYTPALSATRRTTVRLEVSPSVIENPSAPSPGGWQHHLQGEASVEYPFRPKWRAEASYRRGLEYVPGLGEPLLSGGARVRVSGAIGRRVDVVALAGHASGGSALSTNSRNLGTYTGEARIRYALARSYALYSEYLYYSYDLGEQARLAPGLPSVYEQHEIRVGFTVFARALGR
jgi:hypothetical protein